MSKTQQRIKTARSNARRRFYEGFNAAVQQRQIGWVKTWYPKCMAWRAGFFRNGGQKFWGDL